MEMTQGKILSGQHYGVMIWGGICIGAHTELHQLETGFLTASWYVIDILEPLVMTFAPYIRDDFCLMQDNAQAQIAAIAWDVETNVFVASMLVRPKSD